MKAKLSILFILFSLCVVGCQTTNTTTFVEADNGHLIKIVIQDGVDKNLENLIAEYVREDANLHYKISKQPYRFKN